LGREKTKDTVKYHYNRHLHFFLEKPSTSYITAGLWDISRSFGYESTQMSSEEDEQEQEENSHLLESHRESLLRSIMIIDD
jgi:1-aminocyclopropane-1-carboxylate deaminase/D-cysteine desulfhydrase-like pyridoxal-dependent ACC family enzyme